MGAPAAGLLAAALVFAPLCARAATPPPAWSERGMVAASVGPAVPAGVEILAAGGNAIDAAVATAFAAGVAHQFSSGIGGGGFIVVHHAESGETFAVDAREVAPAAAHARMYLDANGEYRRGASRKGGLAVGVPGIVQGLEEVHARYGSLPWARVVEPAIRLCREGVTIGVHHRRILRAAERGLEAFPETRRVQYPADGSIPPLGWRLVQPDLAATLEAIAAQGSKALTVGPLADAIVAASDAHGGLLAAADLQGYRTRWRAPVRGTYRGHEIVSMPPSSSGGIHLVQMLNTLEGFDVAGLGHNSSDYIHLLAGVMKPAFRDRATHLGDADFYPVPQDWLTSKAYARELAARLAPPPLWRALPWNWGRAYLPRFDDPAVPPPDDAGTTHVSVLDAGGNAVALTQTVNTLFGSGITVPGTGIVLNNEMDDFATAPDRPNAWGVTGDRANAVEPGKRPLSSMTPTLVLRDGRPWLAVGSPMGPLIITTVLQTFLNLVEFDLDVQAAVSAPRVHHQWRPDVLRLEPEHARDVVEQLGDMGYDVQVSQRHFGAAAAALRDLDTGAFWGAGDPRRDSGAAGP